MNVNGFIAGLLNNGTDTLLVYNVFKVDPATGATSRAITYRTLKGSTLEEWKAEATTVLKKILPDGAMFISNESKGTGALNIIGAWFPSQPSLPAKK